MEFISPRPSLSRFATQHRPASKVQRGAGKMPSGADAHALAAREILHELPGDTPRYRAPCLAPFNGFRAEFIIVDLDAESVAIAADHAQILILPAGMETEPETETVGERGLLLRRLRWGDRRGALVLDHVTWHQVAPVGGRVEKYIVRPPGNTAIQHRLQRFVMLVIMIETEIIAEDQEPQLRHRPQEIHQTSDRRNILAQDLDQVQCRAIADHFRMNGLDQ